MNDSNCITWEYRPECEDTNSQKFTVAIGTVVEDTTDIFVKDTCDGPPRKKVDNTFVLDGKKDDGSLTGHFHVDQDDGTQKRVDIVRACQSIRVLRK